MCRYLKFYTIGKFNNACETAEIHHKYFKMHSENVGIIEAFASCFDNMGQK